MKRVFLKRLERLKTVAKIAKKSPSDAASDLLFRHKGKLFMPLVSQSGVNWFSFASIKEAIIPFQLASKYIKKSLNDMARVYDDSDLILPAIDSNRRPVVVVLGHFDHGKTTLLDALCGSQIARHEVGGITQVVRTRFVSMTQFSTPDLRQYVTFVDTPGQDIFYRMRNYGASVADMAILVIAIDEGVSMQSNAKKI